MEFDETNIQYPNTDCPGIPEIEESQITQIDITSPSIKIILEVEDAAQRVPHCPLDLKPKLGMIFETLEEGIQFYEKYAKECGFVTRKDREKLDSKKVVTYKQLVCNKQGESKHKGTKRRRTISRIGCNANVKFRRNEKGNYEIYDFEEIHNHVMVTPETMSHLKASRELNLVHKKMIVDNSRLNQGPVKTFRMFKEYVKGYKNVGASLEDFKKISRDVKKYIKQYDAQMLIETFMEKKAMCPSFYFDFDIDEDQNLSKLFWADPIGIKNYALFGDSNSFDTTFDFNKYKMVFAPFTGVDNHKRCVTFAASLIAKENAESFTWIFENFVKAMGGCYPITLITDQCLGIKAGVDNVFKGKTEHRYCMWHIMKKLTDKVSSEICRDTTFLKDITSLIWSDEDEPDESETKWDMILESFGLTDNEWLNQMFQIRESWIPAYFRDTYLGGIQRTTSRSESENSFYSNFTNPHLSLVEFWMRFQSALDAQRWKYSKLTAESKTSTPILKTPLQLEKHAADFYTTTMFYEFQKELTDGCFKCGIENIMKEKVEVIDRQNMKVYNVVCDEQSYKCSCKHFERFGILCRHILCVIKDRGYEEIPREYLLDRWGQTATCRPMFNVANTTLLEDCASISSRQQQISQLWTEVFTSVSLVEQNESSEQELLHILRDFNEKHAATKVHGKAKSKKTEIEMLIGAKIPIQATVLPPKQSKNKGSGRRMISDKDKAIEEHSKPLRKCRACGEMANHDSRNCPSRI